MSIENFVAGKWMTGRSETSLERWDHEKQEYQYAGQAPSLMDFVAGTQFLVASGDSWSRKPIFKRRQQAEVFFNSYINQKEQWVDALVLNFGYPQWAAEKEFLVSVEAIHWVLAQPPEGAEGRPYGLMSFIMDGSSPLLKFFEVILPAMLLGNRVLLTVDGLAYPAFKKLHQLWLNEVGVQDTLQVFYCGDLMDPQNFEYLEIAVTHPSVRFVGCWHNERVGLQIRKFLVSSTVPLHLECEGRNSVILGRTFDFEEKNNKQALFEVLASCHYRRDLRGSRVFIPEIIYDEFVSKIVSLFKNPIHGPDSLGRWQDRGRQLQSREAIESYKRAGCEPIELSTKDIQSPGSLLAYGFNHVNNCLPLQQDSLSGPVFSMTPYKNSAEAIKFANTTRWGKVAYIFHSDQKVAKKWGRQLNVGWVMINSTFDSMTELPQLNSLSSGITRGTRYWDSFQMNVYFP